MTEWRELTLGEVCELKRGYDLPTHNRLSGDVPIVSSSGITGFHAEAKVTGPGVVTGRYGTLGAVFYIETDFWPLNTALYVRDFKGNEPRFVAVLLESLDLGKNEGAAAVPGVNRNQLHKLPVRLPDITSQRMIATIIGSLDDLIENNRRRVEVLEEMARAIYREWFVHLRFPGHEHVTFVDSDLGPIPEVWECSPLANHTSLISRGIAPKYADDGEWVVLNQRCIRNRRVSLLPARRHGGDVARKKHLIHGDILINSTGVGTLGRVAQWRGDDNATTDSHVTIVRSIRTDDHLWLAHWAMENARHFESLGTGATGQTELSRTDIQNTQLPVPPADIRVMFGDTVQSTIKLADLLMARSEALVGMRDLLLPKLVTGQIDVSNLDLDAVVEQAGV